ncbi:MAG: prohibitin family protein [Alphaproteobacteria bacterium]|nr:prohibitin family protein [Alphaproteobacteria bacterium]
METKNIIKYSVLGVVALIAVCCIFSSFFVIDAGYRGVKSTLGTVEEYSYQNGVGFKAPFITKVIEFDVRTKKMNEKTSCYTADMQTAEIDYTVTYNLKGDNVHMLYTQVGQDYEAKKIVPILNDVIKSTIGQWQAQELVSNRDSARISVTAGLQQKLDSRYFENVSFQFNNIDYSDAFEKSIEAKVIAGQQAEKAINDTKRIEQEAHQKVIAAEADAKAMTIKAEALAKNKGLTEYEAVQKWDGKLPTYMFGGSVPMIQVPTGK